MKPIYIFDLDGTLADGEHRLHYIQQEPKQWREYFAACADDKPIDAVIRIFDSMRTAGCECWIWTGRSDEVEKETRVWIKKYCGIVFHPWRAPESFLMRKAGDHRNDDVLKFEWLADLEPPERNRVAGVFEDRSRVVQMWRNAGVPCFQVAPGDF